MITRSSIAFAVALGAYASVLLCAAMALAGGGA